MEGHQETEMCVRCAGECCRRQPGYCLPRDFGSPQSVRAAVESGRYVIMLVLDENVMVRIIRPNYSDPEKKRGCTFLKEKGCALEFPDRPYGCRMLKPRDLEDGHCEPEGVSIEDAGLMWEESGYLPPIWKCVAPR